LNSVAIGAGPTFTAGRPTRLIERRYFSETAFIGRTYDVSPDGNRFLMVKEGGTDQRPMLVVVQDWLSELERLVSTTK
jgi:hypothetical protein